MAHTVSGASLEGIYNRLNGIEQHHPLEADTFADWSVEAGDVVTISRDGKSYQSPIHTSTIKWQGKAPMVSVSSTGNEKREPISKVSRQKYSRGGSGGYRSNRWFYNEIWSEDGYLHSVLSQTESNFHVYVEDTYAQLRSGLELESSIPCVSGGLWLRKGSQYGFLLRYHFRYDRNHHLQRNVGQADPGNLTTSQKGCNGR